MTINDTTPEARQLAQTLLRTARFGALAVRHPKTGAPHVTRVALLADGADVITLVSSLSLHTQGLMNDPECSVLIGEPAGTGDPLVHPRMTLTARATATEKTALRRLWLQAIPKAKLYYDFTDFVMFRLVTQSIDLNGGFGKAFALTPADMTEN